MLHDRYLIETLYQKQCKMFNVGAMLPYMNYTPKTLSSILYDGGLYYLEYLKSEPTGQQIDDGVVPE
jgi:hypothetical protein